ncbi:4'-phosphopantetheinyl transferase family protein [Streptomyces sp. NPDC021020]|uniref:4'-phosphopantetheinyl transferase family protein n=1 Tax=Streptomyces sp. NPDC021020 TaxID=3365109 RepID=UPI003789F316
MDQGRWTDADATRSALAAAEITAGQLPVPVRLWLLAVPAGPAAERVPCLDAGEHRRMAAFRREADRVRYGYAHLALRLVLGDHLGLTPGSVRFTRADCPCCGGPHGRPVVAAAGCEFSLSHGGDQVMIGLAGHPVGVDVEPHPTPAAVTDLAPTLHPAERLALARAGDAPAAFARLWTRKEAYLKGLGTGLGRDLAADDLTTSPPGWAVADVPAPPHHAAAVAVAAGPVPAG